MDRDETATPQDDTEIGRGVDDLIASALAEPEGSDPYWESVWTLQRRGDHETYNACAALCRGGDSRQRELGVDVLCQLGARAADYEDLRSGVTLGVYADDRPFRAPAADLLLELLDLETHPRVIASIVMGLGHLEDDRAIAAVVRFRAHDDEGVRYGVVMCLLGQDVDLAVDTLVELSTDLDADVRDWATFGLGSQIDRDTQQVRDALAARLDDSDQDTRGEAIVGLGVRGDERAISPLLALLEEGWEGPLLSTALYGLGRSFDDLRLRPHLAEHWRERGESPEFDPAWGDDELLLAAAQRHGLTESDAV